MLLETELGEPESGGHAFMFCVPTTVWRESSSVQRFSLYPAAVAGVLILAGGDRAKRIRQQFSQQTRTRFRRLRGRKLVVRLGHHPVLFF